MSVRDFFRAVGHHLLILIAVPILCAAFTAAVCWWLLPDVYTASVSLFVRTVSVDTEDAGTYASSSQANIDDVASLVKGSLVCEDTCNRLGLSDLDDYSITTSSDSSVLLVSVSGTEAVACATVANTLAESTDKVARQIMDIKSVDVINEAVTPLEPTGPARMLYTVIAFVAGIFIALAIIALVASGDTRIDSARKASEMLGLPILGAIPESKEK